MSTATERHPRQAAADAYFTIVPAGMLWTIEAGGFPFGYSVPTRDEADEICAQLRHAFVMGAVWQHDEQAQHDEAGDPAGEEA